MAKALHINDWVSMVKAFATTPKRDRLIGVSVTLAARLLGISRARVHQLGDFEHARASCEIKPDYWSSQWCLAVVHDKLGRHADAEAQLQTLKAAKGDDWAYYYAEIYAQWGNIPKALQWLETALRRRSPGLESPKVEPLLDPLRKKPRFQAAMRELKFPND